MRFDDTPRFEYSKSKLKERVDTLKSLSLPFGLIVRYAVKANPFPEIIKLFGQEGLHFDASSSHEAQMLLDLGIPGEKISLSSQQSAHNLNNLLKEGVIYTATSFKQIDEYLSSKYRKDELSVRINPPVGYGHSTKTSTGGVSSSFGIWHEYLEDALDKASKSGVRINRLHIHIGSGADPKVWDEVIKVALSILERIPGVETLDIGGGYKVQRHESEQETDMQKVAEVFSKNLQDFYKKSGRKIKLEIEPGTFLVAHAGALFARVDDIVDTGKDGYTFLRLNTGMNDFLRTTLYGAWHKIEVLNDAEELQEYVVVGHNCESGDIFTSEIGNPENIEPRILKKAQIGDLVKIHDTGAYCASMRAKNYNSFPSADEIMVD